MSLAGPARLKLWPVGQHDQQRHGLHPVNQQMQHLQRGGVGPVRMLAWVYIWFVRGTPQLLQLVFIYEALPGIGISCSGVCVE